MSGWWRDAVVYQAYPRSFADADGDGHGDLPGLTARLDHLAWLGIDALWLNPTYPSPNEDWGYDVADHTGVHPDFGTLADLDRLIDEAGARGIRVLLDLVPCHTSDRHPWFLGEHRDWYVWADEPTNWRSVFGGPAWRLEQPEGRWLLRSFLPEMIDLDWWNEELRAEFERIMRFWLERGVAGFRIDVVHRLVKPRVPYDLPGRGRRDRYPPADLDETHAVLRRWRARVDGVLVGETYVLDVDEMASFYGSGDDELHLAFNFPFAFAPFGAARLAAVVDATEAALPGDAWPAWTGSNHDVARFPTRWCGGDERRIRCALVILLCLRGTPFLYYGDELGMEEAAVPEPRDRARPPRDGCRTPMPWRAGPGAGFTRAGVEPWLPFGDLSRNVEAQRVDPGSTLHLCRDVITARREVEGAYERLPAPPGAWAWRRGKRHAVAVNLAERPACVDGIGGAIRVCTERARDGERVGGRLRLEPWQAALVELA